MVLEQKDWKYQKFSINGKTSIYRLLWITEKDTNFGTFLSESFIFALEPWNHLLATEFSNSKSIGSIAAIWINWVLPLLLDRYPCACSCVTRLRIQLFATCLVSPSLFIKFNMKIFPYSWIN